MFELILAIIGLFVTGISSEPSRDHEQSVLSQSCKVIKLNINKARPFGGR